jgi:uncharacterized protein (TIGR03437 family)
MRFCLALRALAILPCAVTAEDVSMRQAPSYAASSLVNLATGLPGRFAPNTLVALHGMGLSASTVARESSANGSPSLPASLGTPPVNVKINGFFAPLEYVSPELVVFLIPADQFPGPASIRLTSNNLNGPLIRIVVDEFAPALFELERNHAFARHADGLAPVTAQSPATPGETIILYAAGLGEADRPLPPGQAPSQFVPIRRRDELRVLLNGQAVDPQNIIAAGLASGRPGCYEITLRLPPDTPEDPEIAIAMGDAISQPGLLLPVWWTVERTEPQPAAAPARSNQ